MVKKNADFNHSEGEQLRVVEVGRLLETVRKQVFKKYSWGGADRGLTIKQKPSAPLINHSQTCFKVAQGLETWRACSVAFPHLHLGHLADAFIQSDLQ